MPDITFTRGDILAADVDAVVIPTNCRGVQGAGLAKQAAQRWPEWSRWYADECAHRRVSPGDVSGRWVDRVHVVALATKDHWRAPSRIEWIEQGLRLLPLGVALWEWRSLALPPLGCGLGGLRWDDVRPLVVRAAERMTAAGVRVVVFEPKEPPHA